MDGDISKNNRKLGRFHAIDRIFHIQGARALTFAILPRHATLTALCPTIRDGETYALDRGMTEADALAYWLGDDRETFVAEENGELIGTYYIRTNQAGGGKAHLQLWLHNDRRCDGAWCSPRHVSTLLGLRAAARLSRYAVQLRRQHHRKYRRSAGRCSSGRAQDERTRLRNDPPHRWRFRFAASSRLPLAQHRQGGYSCPCDVRFVPPIASTMVLLARSAAL